MSKLLVLVEHEVEEKSSTEDGRLFYWNFKLTSKCQFLRSETHLHLWQAVGGEVDDEAVAVGEELLAHVGRGLRDPAHLLRVQVGDQEVRLGR